MPPPTLVVTPPSPTVKGKTAPAALFKACASRFRGAAAPTRRYSIGSDREVWTFDESEIFEVPAVSPPALTIREVAPSKGKGRDLSPPAVITPADVCAVIGPHAVPGPRALNPGEMFAQLPFVHDLHNGVPCESQLAIWEEEVLEATPAVAPAATTNAEQPTPAAQPETDPETFSEPGCAEDGVDEPPAFAYPPSGPPRTTEFTEVPQAADIKEVRRAWTNFYAEARPFSVGGKTYVPSYVVRGTKHTRDLADQALHTFDLPLTWGPALEYPAENDCLVQALAAQTNIAAQDIWSLLSQLLSPHERATFGKPGFTLGSNLLQVACLEFGLRCTLEFTKKSRMAAPSGVPTRYGRADGVAIRILWTDGALGHFSSPEPTDAQISGARQNVPGWHVMKKKGLVNRKFANPKGFADVAITELESTLKFEDYTFAMRPAKSYSRDVANRTIGTLEWGSALTDVQRTRYKAVVEGEVLARPNRTVSLCNLAGSAGSAKTTTLVAWMKKYIRPGLYKYSAPRTFLRNAIADKVGNDDFAWMHQTAELSAIQGCAKVLIVDESDLYTPGQIEFALALDPEVTHVVLLHDPNQNVGFVRDENANTKTLPSYVKLLAGTLKEYRWVGYRNCTEVNARLGVPQPRDRTDGHEITVGRRPIPGRPAVMPTTRQTDAIQGVSTAYTYSNCQGQDFDEDYSLLVTSETLDSCSLEALYTAATRGKRGMRIVLNFPLTKENCAKFDSNPILAALTRRGPPLNFRKVFSKNVDPKVYITPRSCAVPSSKVPICVTPLRDMVYARTAKTC